jgi:hypothetical protein
MSSSVDGTYLFSPHQLDHTSAGSQKSATVGASSDNLIGNCVQRRYVIRAKDWQKVVEGAKDSVRQGYHLIRVSFRLKQH